MLTEIVRKTTQEYVAEGTYSEIHAAFPPADYKYCKAIIGGKEFLSNGVIWAPTGGGYLVEDTFARIVQNWTPTNYTGISIYEGQLARATDGSGYDVRMVGGVWTPQAGSGVLYYVASGTWAALSAAHASTPYVNGTRLWCTDSVGYDILVVSGALIPQTKIYSGLFANKPVADGYPDGTEAWFTDRPDSHGGKFIVRGTSTPGTKIWDRVGGGPVAIDTLADCNTYNLTDYDGCTFRVTDIGAGNIVVGGLDFIAAGGYLRPKNYVSSPIQLWGADFTDFATCGFLLVGGNGGTYSQTGTTITVTLTAHGIPSDLNESKCHLTIGTGSALTGWFSNFAYVDANTFTVTSDVSQSTSGNLAANTSNTTVPWKYTFPDGLIKRKDSIALAGYTRAKATAGTKTIRYLYSGAQRAASTITNSDVFTATGASSQVFVGGDDRFLTTGAAALATDTDRTYSVQMQLATNTDWVWFLPNSVQWAPRFGL